MKPREELKGFNGDLIVYSHTKIMQLYPDEPGVFIPSFQAAIVVELLRVRLQLLLRR